MTQAERLFGSPEPIQYPEMDLKTLCECRNWLIKQMSVRRDRIKARKLLVLVTARIMEEGNVR